MAASPDPAEPALAAAGDRVGSDTGGGREGHPASTAGTAVKMAARLAGIVMVAGASLWLSVSTGVKRIDSGLFLRPVALHMMAGEPYDPALIEAMDTDMSVVMSDPVCEAGASALAPNDASRPCHHPRRAGRNRVPGGRRRSRGQKADGDRAGGEGQPGLQPGIAPCLDYSGLDRAHPARGYAAAADLSEKVVPDGRFRGLASHPPHGDSALAVSQAGCGRTG